MSVIGRGVHGNDAVVWWSIVTFSAALVAPPLLSDRGDWEHARATLPVLLPLVLILVLNRVLGRAGSTSSRARGAGPDGVHGPGARRRADPTPSRSAGRSLTM